jgi:hypothetical protein
VDPINARLVRIGDQSTPMERLAQADAEFDPQASGLPAKAAPASTQPDASASAGPGEPSSPQPATAAPSAPASTQPDAPASAGPGEPSSPQPAAPSFGRQPPPPPPPLDEWPRGRRLTFHAGGGYLRTVEEGSCGGPSTIYVNVPFTAGLSIGREAAPSDELRESWQVGVGVLGERWSRATEGKPERDVEGLDLLGTFGGIYHWDWRWIGLGVGGMAGFGRANAPDRFPIAIGDVGFAVPGAYFRVGPPVFAYESGLGNVDLYWPGVFGGFRTIFNAGHALRFGWHLPRWSRPLATSMFYLDLRLRVAAAHGLILRVDVPAKSFNAVHGIAGWAVDF